MGLIFFYGRKSPLILSLESHSQFNYFKFFDLFHLPMTLHPFGKLLLFLIFCTVVEGQLNSPVNFFQVLWTESKAKDEEGSNQGAKCFTKAKSFS